MAARHDHARGTKASESCVTHPPSLSPSTVVAMSSPNPPPEASSSRDFVKQSSLYQEFLAEREEILRHKWLESERLGYDIGFERALLDWIRKHREGWRAARRSQVAHVHQHQQMQQAQAKAAAAAAASGQSS